MRGGPLGLRPRSPGASVWLRRFSIAATNPAKPSGRPVGSPRLKRLKCVTVGLNLDEFGKTLHAVEPRPDGDEPGTAPRKIASAMGSTAPMEASATFHRPVPGLLTANSFSASAK